MRSIDNLREWANGLHGVYINQVDHTITVTTGWDAPPDMDSVSLRDHVNGILDAIEREVDDMVPLPVDADGVPIHVGDVIELDSGAVEEVESMHYYGSGGWTTTTTHNATAMPSIIRHHHAPTVEDVLREFVERLDEIGSEDDCVGEAEQECRACIRRDVAAAYSEYAAKLMLKEE